MSLLEDPPPKKQDWPLATSAAICYLLALVYAFHPDPLAGLTIWPFWVWFGIAGLLFLIQLKRDRIKPRLIVLAAWIVTWTVCGDEPLALLRSFHPPGPTTDGFTVVSLNCAGGTVEAAEEVFDLNPSIVLFQESPGHHELEAIRTKLGKDWNLLSGPDASIMVRGTIEPVHLPRGTDDFVMARVHIPEFKRVISVVSLRLTPPVLRFDYWNLDCWTAYAANREFRRKELDSVVQFASQESRETELLIGGDFNTPPDPVVMRLLQYSGRDSFRAEGRGWGATAVNDYPMVRIDQIWATEGLIPITASARKTKNSDHRLTFTVFEKELPN